MGREALITKDRVCPTCKTPIFTHAEGLRTHVLICEFEARTGLTVISEGKGFTISKVGDI